MQDLEVLLVSINQYLDLFLEESREHLQSFNDEMLKLEQNPGNKDSLNTIFRDIHTLKGMAATMGFEQVTTLSHKLETLLDKLRSNSILLTPELADLLFNGVDILNGMIETIASGENKVFDIELFLEKLDYFNKDTKNNTANTENKTENIDLELSKLEKKLIMEAKKKNLSAYQIEVEFDTGCLMKSVRAFMVVNTLEKLGEIIKTVPHTQELESENFNNCFTVLLLTNYSPPNIMEAMSSISEITLKRIQVINGEDSVAKSPDHGSDDNYRKEMNNHTLSQTVRVDISKLDKLMSLVGELVINKSRLEQIFKQNNFSALNETVVQINKITSDLQNVVMSTRMVPIEQVFNRFPRMVRDLSKELGKQINLVMEGKDTELDRKVIDEIGDPLVHLVRNSIDHGIEPAEERQHLGKPIQGTLELAAKQEGNSIVIIVKDDGRGIDVEKIKAKALEKGMFTDQELELMDEASIINLIFSPGFSTAATVTDISGRGVGLDVVKAKIQSLNGSIIVESQVSQGTVFTIKLPLTLAIIQALMIDVSSEVYAIPLANIVETTAFMRSKIKTVQGQKVIVLRDNVLRLVNLAEVLETPVRSAEQDRLNVVVVKKDQQQIGLVVDGLLGLQEIVISSLGKLLRGIEGISGAAVLGDGKVALILDISTL